MIDVLFVNPPSPDEHVYIRDINRSGRRSRERTIWPQTSLALLAAVLKKEGYNVDVVDCIGLEMDWNKLKAYMKKNQPQYVVTNAITSIISNDLYATYLGKFFGACTVAVGPHVTSMPAETLERFPSLDFVSRIEMSSTDFSEAIEDCSVVADSCSFISEPDKFIIKAKGSLNSFKSEFTDEVNLQAEQANSKYSLEYLQKMIKASKITDKVNINFSSDYPLKLEFNTPFIELNFILAPRVETDD